MKYIGALLIGLLLLVGGCDSNAVFKDIEDIEDGRWFVRQSPTFTFQIEDTTQTYSIFYNIRNSLSYPYYNLYISRVLLDSAGKTVESKLDELILLDPKSGKPYGDGLGDLFDHKIKVADKYRFPRRGQYTIRLRQYMRQNPLPEIYSVGISVEKEI
ncbi:gliding motility lipoprotein GldH [Tellurirhabdus rosea]|uniref:gliding motility lipoprotein GldH n=1 Tax=Tellurirhabdus rosea TaxID=2674997 RepID=UPI00224EF8B8|nr:gliding motility lipoprotein GldH [Tellurirhabdus rosea]